MFNEILRELKKIERMKVPIQLPLDEDGYLDRRCPSENCGSEFKVQFEDWRDKVRDEGAYCPICRVKDKGTEWNTEAQIENIKSVGLDYAHRELNKAMQRGTKQSNRQPSMNSFLKISLSVKPGTPPAIIPIEAAETM